MALGDPYVDCSHLIGENEIVNALHVTTADGFTGLRVINKTAAAADITDVIACGAPLKSFLEVLQASLALTATGKVALVLIEET